MAFLLQKLNELRACKGGQIVPPRPAPFGLHTWKGTTLQSSDRRLPPPSPNVTAHRSRDISR